MNDLLFVSAKADPILSFQEGLDEGHDGLNVFLKKVVGHLPSALLKIVVDDIGRFEREEPVSPVTEKLFRTAIFLYQEAQLSNVPEVQPAKVS